MQYVLSIVEIVFTDYHKGFYRLSILPFATIQRPARYVRQNRSLLFILILDPLFYMNIFVYVNQLHEYFCIRKQIISCSTFFFPFLYLLTCSIFDNSFCTYFNDIYLFESIIARTSSEANVLSSRGKQVFLISHSRLKHFVIIFLQRRFCNFILRSIG